MKQTMVRITSTIVSNTIISVNFFMPSVKASILYEFARVIPLTPKKYAS